MTDDNLNTLVSLTRNSTALGRLSWREVTDAVRFMEANGYSIGVPANTFTTHQITAANDAMEYY